MKSERHSFRVIRVTKCETIFFNKSNIDKDKDDLTSVVYWLTVCRVVHRFRKQPTRFVLENE